MHILVLCPHFAPDSAPTGVVMTRSSRVSPSGATGCMSSPRCPGTNTTPSMRSGGGAVRSETDVLGRISRVHPFPTDKRNVRAALGSPDSPVSPASGPLPSPPTGRGPRDVAAVADRACRPRRGSRPEGTVRLQHPRRLSRCRHRARPLDRSSRHTGRGAAERFSYADSDAVTVLSDDLRDNVETKLELRHKRHHTRVEVIPNFVDTVRITPTTHDNAYRREHGLDGKIVVMYAGNVGLSQSLDLVIEAARAMRDRDDVVFVINGGGSAPRARVRRRPNAHVASSHTNRPIDWAKSLPPPTSTSCRSNAAWQRSSVPSKLYSVLAAGRPVLASVDPDTEVDRTIRLAGAGLCVPPDDAVRFIGALRSLIDAPNDRDSMGASGRRFVEGWVSPQAVASHYDDLLTAVAAARRRPQW